MDLQNKKLKSAYQLGCSTVGTITKEKFFSLPGDREYKFGFLYGYVSAKLDINYELIIQFYDLLHQIKNPYPVELSDLGHKALLDVFEEEVPFVDSFRLIVDNLVSEYDDIETCCGGHLFESVVNSSRLSQEDKFWIVCYSATIHKYMETFFRSEKEVFEHLK